MKKNDKILIVAILLAVCICGAWIYGRQTKGAYVLVCVDGEEYGTYPLSEEQVIEIGDTNQLEISEGKAKMVSAKCPDQICVQTKAAEHAHEMIVCMPNRVTVEILE